MSNPSFLHFMQERNQLDEAFNSAPYELTMGKKNAGDVFFTFIDEDEKEYRIQFYTPQGLGKNVRQVFIGQKRGSVYPDAIARFKNPMRVIASMIEATKQFITTPLGKTIDGYAVNFSKKALDRGMVLIPKIIRQSGLKQKLNVMDLTYAPVPDRGYVWLVRKGKDPAQVFDGPKMQGITWDDPDKVGDVPVQNNMTSNPDEVTDAKWDALVAAMKKTRFGNSVKTIGNTAIGQVVIDGFKIIAGLIRNQESVHLNFDAYDSGNKQINLPLSSRRFVDIDVNRPEAFKGVVDLALGVIMEIVGRENLTTGAPKQNTNTISSNDLKIPSNAKVFGETGSGFSVQWTVNFPKGTKYEGANLITNVTFYHDRGKAAITPMVALNGRTLNNPRSYEVPLNKESLQWTLDDWSKSYNLVARELGTLGSSNYNPMGLFLGEINVDNNGNVKWGNVDLGVSSNSGKLLNAVSRETDRLEAAGGSLPAPIDATRWLEFRNAFSSIPGMKVKDVDRAGGIGSIPLKNGYLLQIVMVRQKETVRLDFNVVTERGQYPAGWDINNRHRVVNTVADMQKEVAAMVPLAEKAFTKSTPSNSTTGKTGVELATYAGSIRDNAPKGRDLDWQIYASRDGQILNVDWDITFRRNTTEGAYREFKAQIERANQYLQSLYQDAKSKGYNPTEPNLMTLARAKQSDEWAQDNGESAYSEYEQTIGGNMQIKI